MMKAHNPAAEAEQMRAMAEQQQRAARGLPPHLRGAPPRAAFRRHAPRLADLFARGFFDDHPGIVFGHPGDDHWQEDDQDQDEEDW